MPCPGMYLASVKPARRAFLPRRGLSTQPRGSTLGTNQAERRALKQRGWRVQHRGFNLALQFGHFQRVPEVANKAFSRHSRLTLRL